MPAETCILTTKDFTILEAMRDRCQDLSGPYGTLLRRKLDTAQLVLCDDVPADVPTLNSRVTFSVDGRDPDTRVLSQDRMPAAVGMFLPITTLRGLALLGLAEGQAVVVGNQEGREEMLSVEKVSYQPEATRREREMLRRAAIPSGRPRLRVIEGGANGLAAFASPVPDDPGPSAA